MRWSATQLFATQQFWYRGSVKPALDGARYPQINSLSNRRSCTHHLTHTPSNHQISPTHNSRPALAWFHTPCPHLTPLPATANIKWNITVTVKLLYLATLDCLKKRMLPSTKWPNEQNHMRTQTWSESFCIVHKRDLQTTWYRIVGTRYGPQKNSLHFCRS